MDRSFLSREDIFYEDNLISVNYIETLNDALEEIRFKLNRSEVVFQMDNTWYHWTIKAFEIYSNNEIKVIDWPPYSPVLNPIENIWIFMSKKW